MKTILMAILLCGLCGCTTIKRESISPDGTRTVYTLNSALNSKTIAGLKLKDTGGQVELTLTDYTSDQDAALQVVLAALQAYLATMK